MQHPFIDLITIQQRVVNNAAPDINYRKVGNFSPKVYLPYKVGGFCSNPFWTRTEFGSAEDESYVKQPVSNDTIVFGQDNIRNIKKIQMMDGSVCL